ncbi:EmrB/QacA subfamily drug resistance transporter [Paenibacillus rhizosphaerae]|uniref:EmrB/QacA subfamily drug resistance transporter n=1 Tax=Paenibacillus rhizosphaerae TaxID=297318 RepID=A0A839TVH0_9BACL|nr:DHA2 family efflux MFS transporter permease subunit [Paenibacillus rhizosphaerae]MBB3128687.1 EmrB/QacA subfamily drug resistance transporter [Paenibacillus rhizosphaerae]
MTLDSHEIEQAVSIKAMIAPLATIVICIFMVFLDSTAMNVMLTELIGEFDSSFSSAQWALTGYTLAQAAVIPITGWLSDRWGSKNVLLTSTALFTAGSLLCALSVSMDQLVLFRIVQGLGGGMVMPVALSMIYRISPPGKTGTVMGLMGIPILLAPAFGPTLSGWLVDYASWSWIFLINIPIGITGLIIGIWKLPRLNRQHAASLDTAGMILAPVAFAAICFGISESVSGWNSTSTIISLTVGLLSLILLTLLQLRRKNPLLELRVFASANYTKGIIVQWIAQFALFGTAFLVPQYLQNAKGFSAFEAGLIMLAQGLASSVFVAIGGRLFDKLSSNFGDRRYDFVVSRKFLTRQFVYKQSLSDCLLSSFAWFGHGYLANAAQYSFDGCGSPTSCRPCHIVNERNPAGHGFIRRCGLFHDVDQPNDKLHENREYLHK